MCTRWARAAGAEIGVSRARISRVVDEPKIVIVGTGISALLLAQSLIARGSRQVRLVGPKTPLRPHLLSYWSDTPTPFDAHAIACWSEVSVVSAGGREIRSPLERFRYRTIRAASWADSVRRDLPLLEGRVQRVDDGIDGATVFADGRTLDADWVFFSGFARGFTGAEGRRVARWQRFTGWEVELDGVILDHGVARLLDFRTKADGDFRFVYALPLGPSRLFVEHVSYAPCDHEAAIVDYLRHAIGARTWRVVDRETGATPIFASSPERGEHRVMDIGVRGGMAKTATGYAIMRMWRDAERIADSLARFGHPHGEAPLPSLSSFADRFFLDLLEREPSALPDALCALFQGAPADAVLAFLDDRAHLAEQLAVARAMPNWFHWFVTGG